MAEHQGLLPSERPLQLLDETGTPVDGSGLVMPDHRRLLEAYTSLVIGRRVNDQAGALVRQGRLAVYPSSHGQEACQTGAALVLEIVQSYYFHNIQSDRLKIKNPRR